MKGFKKYILEEIDRTALPPPTVIYPKDINPEMLDPSELPMYRYNLPPLIDWRALDQKFLSLLRLYEILLGFLKIYGYVPPTILRQLEVFFIGFGVLTVGCAGVISVCVWGLGFVDISVCGLGSVFVVGSNFISKANFVFVSWFVSFFVAVSIAVSVFGASCVS